MANVNRIGVARHNPVIIEQLRTWSFALIYFINTRVFCGDHFIHAFLLPNYTHRYFFIFRLFLIRFLSFFFPIVEHELTHQIHSIFESDEAKFVPNNVFQLSAIHNSHIMSYHFSAHNSDAELFVMLHRLTDTIWTQITKVWERIFHLYIFSFFLFPSTELLSTKLVTVALIYCITDFFIAIVVVVSVGVVVERLAWINNTANT